MRQRPALERILEAMSRVDAQVVCSLGGVELGSFAAPDNVTITDWVDHDLVLPYAAAVVSHGGLSTVLGALSIGVPLVLLPMADNGSCIRKSSKSDQSERSHR